MNVESLFLEATSVYDESCHHVDEQDMNTPILVAVSGGVDSMVLLHIMERVSRARKLTCIAVHVNHGLRDSATADEEFVASVCRDWGVRCETVRLHLREQFEDLQSVPSGLEELARKARYESFFDVAVKWGVKRVFIGHHADDQLETMLWRLARGTSLTGLAGMRPLVKNDGLLFVRPLLSQTRATICEYATFHQIDHVEDETNQDVRYTRNQIRHEVVPALCKLHPRAAHHASQLADLLRVEDDFMEGLARDVVHRTMHFATGEVHTNIKNFRSVPLPLQRRAIKILLYYLAEESWSMRHIEAVLRLVEADSPSATLHLQGNVLARRSYESLWVGKGTSQVGVKRYQFGWTLGEGATLLGVHDGKANWEFRCERFVKAEGLRTSSLWETRIPPLPTLVVRSAEAGERLSPLGMTGTKKAQDVFTDAKVERAVRWSWPILCDDSGNVLWVPGVLRSSHALLSDDDSTGWTIRAHRLPETGETAAFSDTFQGFVDIE